MKLQPARVRQHPANIRIAVGLVACLEWINLLLNASRMEQNSLRTRNNLNQNRWKQASITTNLPVDGYEIFPQVSWV